MSRLGRRGLLLALIGIILVGCGFLIISAIVRNSLAPLAVATQPPPLTEQVVVARRDLALGSVLDGADLVQIEVQVELAPEGALTDVKAAEGKLTTIPLVAGELVLAHHLADPTNLTNRDLAFTIADNQVLMAFPTTDLMSNIQLLKRGDLVDILVSVEQKVEEEESGLAVPGDQGTQQDEKELFTFDALQRVVVQAMVVEVLENPGRTANPVVGAAQNAAGATPAPTPEPAPSQVEPQALLLALSPQDALVLKHLKDAGGMFDIVLRAPNSNSLFDTLPVSPDYLKDRYNLDTTR